MNICDPQTFSNARDLLSLLKRVPLCVFEFCLYNQCFNVNAEFKIQDQECANLLTLAAECGSIELIEMLQDYKFDFETFFIKYYNNKNENHSIFGFAYELRPVIEIASPYVIFCQNGFVDCLKLLQKILGKTFCNLARKNEKNQNKHNPLVMGSMSQNGGEMVEFLLQNVYFVNDDLKDSFGVQALNKHDQQLSCNLIV